MPKNEAPKNETPAKRAAPKPFSADRIRAEAAKRFAEHETPASALAALPKDERTLDARARRATRSILYPVYWRLAGEASPLVGKTRKARANDLARRRLAGVRFEILAASLGVSNGYAKPATRKEVEAELALGGIDADTSYAGRGTRRSPAGEAARVLREKGTAKG